MTGRDLPAGSFSTPRFLAAQRSAVSSRREEVAQRKPFKRVFSGLFRKQKGCGPFEIPGVPDLQCPPSRASSTYFGSILFLACKYLLACKKSDDFTAEQQIWKTCPPQGIFALQKSLRGGLRWGTGVLIAEGEVPRAKKFPEEICFAPSRVCQVCRTPDYRVLKSTQYAQLVQPSVPGSSGVPEGPRPSVSEGVQRKPFQGFPLGNFFAAARHRASLRS